MKQKDIYKIIRSWELSNGESFFEYFFGNCGNGNAVNLMFWLYGKGYIDVNKLNLFLEEVNNENTPSPDECLCEYEVEYALFPYGECDEDANLKAELIIAEFIAENVIYEKRLTEFAFEGKGWASFDNEEHKVGYKEDIQSYISNWDDEDERDYKRVCQLNIDSINDRLKIEYE